MKARCNFIVFVTIMVVLLAFSTGSASEPLQTQPSSDGKLEADLTQAKVKKAVLTVKIRLKNQSDNKIEPEICFGNAYYADIDEKKKYFPLKDSEGRFIAGPQSYDWCGGTYKEKIDAGAMSIMWIKFPAPVESTESVDIFLPGFLPFEDVQLQR